MLKIGVTGGIGAGKSLICRVFSVLAVPVYDADYRAKRIMEEDSDLQLMLKTSFGNGVIKEGRPDRRALAELVFKDPVALKRLNEIVHPAVRHDFISWLVEHNRHPYIIKEAAILFETGAYTELDFVILVTAPENVRLQRIMKRDGADKENIRDRMASQWTDEKKSAIAGMVIRNDNNRAILPLILLLHSQLSKGQLPEKNEFIT